MPRSPTKGGSRTRSEGSNRAEGELADAQHQSAGQARASGRSNRAVGELDAKAAKRPELPGANAEGKRQRRAVNPSLSIN